MFREQSREAMIEVVVDIIVEHGLLDGCLECLGVDQLIVKLVVVAFLALVEILAAVIVFILMYRTLVRDGFT